ncbi:MAG: hypothetical protein LBH06_05005 [Rikenellaceae bacterium]|jgi:hypothetical protein|nr:hypothetical protein [Rikenellaceae bacterium]
MEQVVQALVLLLLANCAIRLSFWRGWQAAIFGLVCGAFVVIVCTLATQQSRTELAAMLADRTRMQDLAVAVTIEGTVCLTGCFLAFKRMRGGRASRWGRALHWYPSLLIFPALLICLTQAIYALPGVGFDLIAWSLAAAVAVGMPLLGLAARRLLPEAEFRMETHFLLSLVVCVMGLLATVDGTVVYVAAKQPFNFGALLAFVSTAVALLIVGRWLNKRKFKKR